MQTNAFPLRRLLALAGCAALAAPVLAARPAAVVEGVQMPAWVEREGGARVPVSPGMVLKSGDQVHTGDQARLLVKLAEGSLVKLGENGSMRFAEVDAARDGLFRAALKVAEGAFRFTTDALQRGRRRDVAITVATVTAGIRGTDLWGKSDRADRQIVCLIEGAIDVAAAGEAPVRLDQPLQFYQRDRGVTAPVAFVPPAQLAEWAQETEIATGAGASRRGGRYAVTLAQSDTPQGALAVYDQLRAAGYAATIRPATVAGRLVYFVRIAQLPSKAEAESLAASLKGRFGVVDPRVPG